MKDMVFKIKQVIIRVNYDIIRVKQEKNCSNIEENE